MSLETFKKMLEEKQAECIANSEIHCNKYNETGNILYKEQEYFYLGAIFAYSEMHCNKYNEAGNILYKGQEYFYLGALFAYSNILNQLQGIENENVF